MAADAISTDHPLRVRLEKAMPYLAPLVGLALFVASLWAIRSELGAWGLHDIARAFGNMPARHVALALLATAGSYAVLAYYDVLAVRYLERALPRGRALLAGFVGCAFSNTMGLPLIAGGAVRFRLYTAWGFSAAEIAGIVAFNGVSLWLGVGAMLALGGLTGTEQVGQLLGGLSPGLVYGLSAAVALLLAGYVTLPLLIRRERIDVWRWSVALPTPRMALLQLALAVTDWTLAAATLWMLIPGRVGVDFATFASLFSVACLAGAASHVPAGLGVFEAVLLLALPGAKAEPSVAAALVAYRIIYFIVPLLAAAVLFAWCQLRETGMLKAARGPIGRVIGWAHFVIPNLAAALVFLAGVVLLVSGATPSAASRLAWITPVAPLALIEVSHFLGSLAGLALVLLALGLRRRLDAAYVAAAAVLAAGILFSLAKGFDWEEALYLALVLAVLLPCRGAFYRRSALLDQHLSPSWLAAIAAVLLGTVWLGLFSYRHVDYANDLWWEFLAEADAPRFLRATAGLFIAAVAIGVLQLLRYGHPEMAAEGSEEAIARATAAIGAAEGPPSMAWLATLGDKRFLFSPTGRSFIMYGVKGRSWVALGEPVGLRSERLELLWHFRELCDEWGGRVVFYEVPSSLMPDLVELGLAFYKVGEQAYVDLARFGLEGNAARGIRYTLRKARKEGASLEIIPPEGVGAVLPRLRQLSDEWIEKRSAREKGFSLGRFDEGYLRRFPVAVIRREGRIVAFANVWPSPDKGELSVDLMRYGTEAPRDVMEHLFIELMLWGKEQGYGRFDLGMAPLAGLENRKLAPLWSRAGALIFQHGEDFYNFEGLRRFKEKFRPDWEPRYLAVPGGLSLPAVLADVTFLIGGGVGGVLMRRPAPRPASLGTQPA